MQYDRTIRDLLGVTALTAANNVTPSQLLATDQLGGLSDLGWSAYKDVADKVATQVMADPALKAKFLKCTPTGDGKACLHETIVAFGRRAFRRPLTPEEIAAFDGIVSRGKEVTPNGTPEEIARAVLYLFLTSPSFITRAETQETSDGAGRYVLSNHEVASRMSYLLWGSTPDETLDKAADAGQLTTREQVLAQAQRMLQDARARDMISAFHRYYLHMGMNTRWDNTNKDATAFPMFNKNLVPLMQRETEMFFDKVVFEQKGKFQDLLLSQIAFVNSATAPIYGLDPSKFGPELQETTLDASRPGFLTRLGFLNAYSSYSRTSPILRGAFIIKDILGIPLGAPPPGAEAAPLPEGADLDTNRKQVDAQTAETNCASCHHTFINPTGFVMERFDTIGKVQTTERLTGAPIDTVANVPINGTPEPISSPAEMMAKIAAAKSSQVQYAYKWVSYGYERDGHKDDACTAEQLAAKVATGNYSVLDLITDLTQTLSFRVRAVETP